MASLTPLPFEDINPLVFHLMAAGSGLLHAWVLACLAGAMHHYGILTVIQELVLYPLGGA